MPAGPRLTPTKQAGTQDPELSPVCTSSPHPPIRILSHTQPSDDQSLVIPPLWRHDHSPFNNNTDCCIFFHSSLETLFLLRVNIATSLSMQQIYIGHFLTAKTILDSGLTMISKSLPYFYTHGISFTKLFKNVK